MNGGHSRVVILDFGSQYTQLIARRVRELGVYSEIHPFDLPLDQLRALEPAALILSGGPSSCYEPRAPTVDPALFDLGIPTLGICYGVQLAVHLLGGQVVAADRREYGRAEVQVNDAGAAHEFFYGFAAGEQLTVWMSHGDRVEKLPAGFTLLAETPNAPAAGVICEARNFIGIQFHPEVAHTPRGGELIANFLFRVAGIRADWSMASFAVEAVARVRAQVGERGRVVCGLSGGVDSTVAARLIVEAIGPRLTCIFVDNGLLRQGERAQVEALFANAFSATLVVVDATERFLTALAGVTDPEQKRKIIGREFIEVFDAEAKRISAEHGDVEFLAQGTLYPDVIESVSVSDRGPSATIKSHHNVGGLPARMKLKLVEPLRELFKDEVRALGLALGLPASAIARQPFPGPGLAVRILGDITAQKLSVLRAADLIVDDEIRAAGLYESIWQSFAVLLPVKSVGVMGDQRTYADAICVRAVHSRDGMTADWVPLPHDLLGTISRRIINEVKGVNRVVYDITSKPPGTIEWE